MMWRDSIATVSCCVEDWYTGPTVILEERTVSQLPLETSWFSVPVGQLCQTLTCM